MILTDIGIAENPSKPKGTRANRPLGWETASCAGGGFASKRTGARGGSVATKEGKVAHQNDVSRPAACLKMFCKIDGWIVPAKVRYDGQPALPSLSDPYVHIGLVSLLMTDGSYPQR